MNFSVSLNKWYLICAGITLLTIGTFTFLNHATSDNSPTVEAAQGPVHGGFVDALDASGEKGESLGSALKRFNRDVELPDPAVVGDVVKAVFGEMEPIDPNDDALLVLYSSGIKVKIVPGEFDFDAALEHTKDSKVGNSKKPFRIETVAGRKTWVAEGGIKHLKPGDMELPKGMTWNNNTRLIYHLEARYDSGVSLDNLKKAAESIE